MKPSTRGDLGSSRLSGLKNEPSVRFDCDLASQPSLAVPFSAGINPARAGYESQPINPGVSREERRLNPGEAGMPTPEQIQDDILFWLGSQDREHMLFMKLGIDPGSAGVLHAEAGRLHAAYENAARTQNIQELLRLSGPSQALKQMAYAESQRRWIGWLFPVFYDHIRREIDYALTRLQRPISVQEEICFWTQIGAEHAVMAAHLLDPTEQTAFRGAMQEYMKMDNLHKSCAAQMMPSMVALTERVAKELDMFFTTAEKAKFRSVIHPTLAAHIVREGRRFVQTMQAMPANAGINGPAGGGMRTGALG